MSQDSKPSIGDCPGTSATMTCQPYGSWRSPITADVLLQSAVRLGEVQLDRGDAYWVEGRAGERGRGVLVRLAKGTGVPVDVTPRVVPDQPNFDVRTAVYSYDGGAWLVDDGVVYFSSVTDGRLYRQDVGSATPVALTPAGVRPNGKDPLRCYADGRIDRRRNRWIGVIEDWSEVNETAPDERSRQPVHSIVAIDLARPNAGTPIVSGQDFYAAPRLSPDGSRLAFLSWCHPQMPWHGTQLYVVELDEAGKSRGPATLVAGSSGISICQPEWSPDGTQLWYVSDESGWWNLYRYSLAIRQQVPVAPMEAEFAQPQWSLGASTYAFAKDGRVVATFSKSGLGRLAWIDTAAMGIVEIDLPFTDFKSVQADADGNIAFVAGGPLKPLSVVSLDPTTMTPRVLKAATNIADDPLISRNFSTPEPITYPTSAGQHAHALFYAPRNAEFTGPETERPPVVVVCHGGPTAQASSTLSLGIQYWTSRGIAVVDINHRGSSGFGRAYRDLLKESWGIVEVEDCINAVKHLAVQGRVDDQRAAIKGGSAGGFTTLSALTFHEFFKAGASHYGIGDLELLARHTHKFESHYLDWLIGPYPDQIDVYRARSPKHHAERLRSPVIFFHGTEDRVVPASQTEEMVQAIRDNGVPFGYLLFEGEAHGFRQRDNQRRAIEAEHSFFSFQAFRSRMTFGQPKPEPTLPVAGDRSSVRTPPAASVGSARRVTASSLVFAARHEHDHHPTPSDRVANERHFHASALIGKDTLFASHLTMLWNDMHMYQLVMQLSLPEPWRSRFVAEREANPHDSYFVANALEDPLIANTISDPFTVSEIAGRLRTSFVGNIFRGIPYKEAYTSWPWAGVRPVLANIPVTVDRIVHFHPFSWTAGYPENLTYLLFGAGREAHMVNLQTRMPDYDHVLSLAASPTWLAEDMLKAGILIDLPSMPRLDPGKQAFVVRCVNPITDGSTVEVRYRGAGLARQVEIGRTFWFCTRIANNPDPCSHCKHKCGTETPAQYLSTA